MVSPRRRRAACWPTFTRRAAAPDTWHVAAVACAVAAALAGALSILVPGRHSPQPSPNCGLVTCVAAVPAPATPGTAAPPTPRASPSRHHRHRDAGHNAPLADPPPPPSPPPPPPPRPRTPRAGPPAARVTVSYSLTRSWGDGFLGQFTITNHGSRPLSHWIVTATLPGDHVDSGWGADYQIDGDTLTLTPASYDRALAPGDSQLKAAEMRNMLDDLRRTTRPTSYSASGH